MPEAKLRDTNDTMGLIAFWYYNKEYILNVHKQTESI